MFVSVYSQSSTNWTLITMWRKSHCNAILVNSTINNCHSDIDTWHRSRTKWSAPPGDLTVNYYTVLLPLHSLWKHSLLLWLQARRNYLFYQDTDRFNFTPLSPCPLSCSRPLSFSRSRIDRPNVYTKLTVVFLTVTYSDVTRGITSITRRSNECRVIVSIVSIHLPRLALLPLETVAVIKCY